MVFKESRTMSIEDWVAVHMTNYFPNGGTIRSRNSVMPRDSLRNSVHFAINHPVQGHNDGNGDNKSYAIISPLDKLVKEEGNIIWNFNVVDTYFMGDVKLPKGTILINSTPFSPTDEQLREMIEKGIRYAIGSRDIRKDVYLLIEKEGFQPMSGGMWNWGSDSPGTIDQKKIAEELGAQYRCHFGSDLAGIEWLSDNLRGISGKVGKKRIQAYLRVVEELGGADQFERQSMNYPEHSDELEGRDILRGRTSYDGSCVNTYIRELEITRKSLPEDYQRKMDEFLDANKAELRTFIPEAIIQQYQLNI